MNIRHKRDKTRIITDVTLEANRTYWFTILNDVVQQYPVQFWEPADVDWWSPITVTVSNMGKSVTHGGSHVATILNTNDFRFSVDNDVLQVEMRS